MQLTFRFRESAVFQVHANTPLFGMPNDTLLHWCVRLQKFLVIMSLVDVVFHPKRLIFMLCEAKLKQREKTKNTAAELTVGDWTPWWKCFLNSVMQSNGKLHYTLYGRERGRERQRDPCLCRTNQANIVIFH